MFVHVRACFTKGEKIASKGEGYLFAKEKDAQGLSGTLHVYRTPRVRVAADTQLPGPVLAPALDPAPRRNDARVRVSQGDINGRDAWRTGEAFTVCICLGSNVLL